MAADVIINRYGLKKYRILIYGSTTHDVVYCRRCQDTIDRLKLNDNVKLMGKGRPAAVGASSGERGSRFNSCAASPCP